MNINNRTALRVKRTLTALLLMFVLSFSSVFAETGTPDFVKWFATSDDLAAALAERPLTGATVLVKGSNSLRMGKVFPTL